MTQCSDLFTTDDSANAKLDAQTLAEVLNNNYPSDTTTNRTGTSLMTVNGAIGLIGYHVPIAYTSGIAFTTLADRFITVEESGVSYAILPSSIPFTTTGTWANDSSNFYLVPTTSSGFNSASDQTITGNWQFKHPIQAIYDGTNYADAIYYQQINALNLLKLGDGNNFAGANVNGKLYVDGAETIRRITANTSVYVATTGNDTTGDGTNGSPFATPHKALEPTQNWIIDKDVTVTISVAAGVYNFTEQIEMNHPCSANILLQGSGNAAAPNTSTNVTTADVEAAFDTRFYFTGSNGLYAQNGNVFNIDNFALLGDTSSGGIMAFSGAIFKQINDNTIAVDKFNESIAIKNGSCDLLSPSLSNSSSISVSATRNSYVSITNVGITNSGNSAVYAGANVYLELRSTATINNAGKHGIDADNQSMVFASNLYAGTSTNTFFRSTKLSFIYRTGATGAGATDASPAVGVEGNNGAWII